jgi:hypothetical protein
VQERASVGKGKTYLLRHRILLYLNLGRLERPWGVVNITAPHPPLAISHIKAIPIREKCFQTSGLRVID